MHPGFAKGYIFGGAEGDCREVICRPNPARNGTHSSCAADIFHLKQSRKYTAEQYLPSKRGSLRAALWVDELGRDARQVFGCNPHIFTWILFPVSRVSGAAFLEFEGDASVGGSCKNSSWPTMCVQEVIEPGQQKSTRFTGPIQVQVQHLQRTLAVLVDGNQNHGTLLKRMMGCPGGKEGADGWHRRAGYASPILLSPQLERLKSKDWVAASEHRTDNVKHNFHISQTVTCFERKGG